MEGTKYTRGEIAWLSGIDRAIDKVGIFSKWINIIGAALIFIISGLVFVDVILRAFGHPIKGVNELVEVMMITAVFFGVAYAYNEKAHIGMDLITSKLAPKARLIMNFITNLLGFTLFVIIVWRVLIQTMLYYDKNVMHGYTPIPVTPFSAVIVVGCTLLCLLMIRDLFRNLHTALKIGLAWYHWLLMAVIPILVTVLAILWVQPGLWQISLITVGLIGIAFSLVFFLTGMPISFVLILTSFLFISHIRGLPTGLDMLGVTVYRTTGNYLWAVVAFFVLMGYFCLHSGFGKDLYLTAYRWIGHRLGGLAMATIAACTGFAAIIGDTLSAVVTFGSLALPEMRKYKYDDRLSTGCIIAGASLGPLIPPSMGAIIYGLLTQVSIGKLFIAIIIPGLIQAIGFILIIIIWCRRNPNLGLRGNRTGWKARFTSLRSIVPIGILAILVVGGIYTGQFSPSEGGAIGAFCAMIIGLVMRRFTPKNFALSLLDSAKVVSMFFLIIIGAVMFSQFMSWCNVAKSVTSFINNMGLPPLGVELFIVFVLFLLGFIIDAGPLLLIGVPIAYPITMALGADPVWFAVCVLLATNLGTITPPVALNIFALKGIARDIPISDMYAGVMPFVISSMIVLMLVFFIPEISTWLPGLLR
ncbi:MAG: TRAP transporter large permease subunit [Dehalococcoidales bacterium]|nr:TRAP transporter large permease subunit [Dehalococcoidales bacterium]